MQTDWYQVGSKWYYLRTNAVNDSYPVGSAVTGAQYLPTTKGSTTRSRNYYFAGNADCSMQEFSYPLDTSKTENLRVNRGIRTSDGHNGLDINSYWKEPITNVGDGTVVYANSYLPNGKGTGTGGTVIVRTSTSDGTNIYVRNFHMNDYTVGLGSISAGTVIGYVGNTGEVYSSSSLPTAGKHLHIDMSLYGKYTSNGPTTLSSSEALNPAAFFPNINFLGSGFFGSDKN